MPLIHTSVGVMTQFSAPETEMSIAAIPKPVEAWNILRTISSLYMVDRMVCGQSESVVNGNWDGNSGPAGT